MATIDRSGISSSIPLSSSARSLPRTDRKDKVVPVATHFSRLASKVEVFPHDAMQRSQQEQ